MYHLLGGIFGCKWYVQTAYSYNTSIKYKERLCEYNLLGRIIANLMRIIFWPCFCGVGRHG